MHHETSNTFAREARLQAILETAVDGIVTVDTRGLVQSMNPAACHMFGWKEREAVGLHVSALRGDASCEGKDLPGYLASLRQPLVNTTREAVGRRRDGSHFAMELSLSEIRRPGLGPIGYVSIARDISARKAREAAVEANIELERKLHEELRQAHRTEAVGWLAGQVAHDFNNLLMALYGCTQIALTALEPTHPSRAVVQEMWSTLQRGSVLTRELVAFSRPPRPSEVVELDRVLRDSHGLIGHLIGTHIHLQVGLGAPAGRVLSRVGEVAQIVVSLAENAADAMPCGGALHIQSGTTTVGEEQASGDLTSGNYVTLVVRDQGSGMDAEGCARLFQPLAERLGLAATRASVRRLGGAMQVESTPGVGTQITVYLPVARAAA